MSPSPEWHNPHIEGPTGEPERCKFCGTLLPDDWDVQGWRELPLRGRIGEAWCCEPCYLAEVDDGPEPDYSGAGGYTAEQQAAWLKVRR